jgi:hypothetical protein
MINVCVSVCECVFVSVSVSVCECKHDIIQRHLAKPYRLVVLLLLQ